MSRSGNPAAFRSSFLFRLVAIFTLVAALITLLVSSIYVMTEIRESRRNNEAMVRLTASGLAESARLPLFAGNREELLSLARLAVEHPEIREVAIFDGAGSILAEVRKPGAIDPGMVRTEVVEVHSRPSASFHESLPAGDGGGDAPPIGKVRVSYDSGRLAAQIRRTILFTGGFALLFWVLVSMLSYPVLRKATHSFNEVLRGLGALREGNYDLTLPVLSGDEIGVATATVNGLAASLKRREEESGELRRSLEREVRERTLAEAESRESERTLRHLLEAIPAGVGWTDLEGNILFLNRFMGERFGYRHAEIPTIDAWFERAYPDPEARRRVRELREAGIASAKAGSGDLSSYEAKVTCGDGTIRDVLFMNQVERNRIVVIMVDITERESMRERVLRAQKLESLGILAGGIAHNFNNVLTSVLGYIGFTRKSLDRPEKARALLAKAEAASRAAASIAGQLLTFARGGEPIKKPVSVGKLVEDSVSLSLMGANVVASVDIPPSLHGIEADEGQLGQAFNNILINAVQAMPNGGTIAIRGENVDPDETGRRGLGAGSYVKVSFADRGCGIPEANRERIFDPYFTTKEGSGTGLGLASVRSIVEKHGGTVTVRSEVGQGTTFTIYLPSTGAIDPGPLPESEAAVPDARPGGSILFMDDEASIRGLICETLEARGYRVTTCDRGEEAVALYRDAMLRGRPFSAAILDLTIPNGLGGKETASRILSLDPGAVLIVSSGYSNDPVMAGFREFGFRAGVSKPYRDDALARELAVLLSGKKGPGRV